MVMVFVPDSWKLLFRGCRVAPGEGPVTVTADGIIAESSVPRWVGKPWRVKMKTFLFGQQIVGPVN